MEPENSDDEGKGTATCNQYSVIRTLGEGRTAKVKLAKDPKGEVVSIKRYKPGMAMEEYINDELKVMLILSHPNIMKLIAVLKEAKWTTAYGREYTCFCTVIEHIGGGELFDYVALTGHFQPNFCRTFFLQLMHGVQHMHQRGICHRDLKPENIMVSDDYALKIVDFGFATLIEGPDKSGILKEKVGTEGYMAPEVVLCKYRGADVDIFACGVILFIMYSGGPPFQKAIVTDPFYRTIKDKNYEAFWTAHSKNKPINYYTQEFKDLFVRMVAYKPEQRLKIDEVLNHPWCKKPTTPPEKVKEEVQQRRDKLKEIHEKMRREKEEKRQKRRSMGIQQHHEEHISNILDDILGNLFMQIFVEQKEAKRNLRTTKKLKATDYVINEDEAFFFASIHSFLDELKGGFVLNLTETRRELKVKEYKMTNDEIFVKFSYDFNGVEDSVDIRILVEKTPKGNLSLSFKRLHGDYLQYKRLIDLIKTEFSPRHIKRQR